MNTDQDIFAPPIDTTPLLPTAKEIAIQNCGKWRWYWNVKKQRLCEYQRFCKYYDDCEICRHRKKKANEKRLQDLYGSAVAIMTPQEFKKFKSDKTQEQYLRVPMSDGTLAIVLENRSDYEGDVQWLKDDLIDMLSTEAVPTKGKGKVSGKLDTMKEQSSLDPFAEFEPQMLIAYREFEIEWNDRLKNAQQLEAIVLDRFDKQHGLGKSLDNLQYVIYQIEQITEQVAKEKNCAKFHFLQSTLINIKYSEVEWNLWPNAPG